MEHLGALRRQFQHLIISNFFQLAGVGHDTGIGGIHTVYIRVDLAQAGLEGGCQRHSAGIGTSAAQCSHIAVAVHALEAGDDDDAVLIQLCLNALGINLFDAGIRVDACGLNAHLPGRQGDAGQAHALQCHGAQGHGDLLAGGEQHIHLPLGGVGIDLLRLGDEIIGGVTLSGQDHDHVVARQIGLRDDAGDVADALGVLHRGTAEFLYDQTHMVSFFALDWSGYIVIHPIIRE